MNLKKQASMFMSGLSPELCSRLLYRIFLHRNLDLKHPKRFSEKLMYLKLNEYADNELVSMCCDKFRVREYIEEKGYSSILCKLYGFYEKAEDIDFDALPDRFVLKCNHGCNYNIIVKDKKSLDIAETRNTLNRWLKEDYWKVFAELNYKPIPKRIICEEFLDDGQEDELTDYKFYCFNGKAMYVMVCIVDPSGIRRFYFFDRDWNMMDFTEDGIHHSDITIKKPEQIDRMFEIAKDLCKPFKFVRTDLYLVKGKIYFGELTFTPSACLDRNRLESTDILFGYLLKI